MTAANAKEGEPGLRAGWLQPPRASRRHYRCPFIQPQWGKGTSQDWIIPLVKKLVDAGEQVIVFREQKGQTVGCATYLARSLGAPPAQATIDALPTGDPSVSSGDLRRTLAGGVAFHNADLDRDERLAIEEHFRSPDHPLQVIVATTTLAMASTPPRPRSSSPGCATRWTCPTRSPSTRIWWAARDGLGSPSAGAR